MDPNIHITLDMIRDEQLGNIGGSYFNCIIDIIFLLQWRRFISGFLHPRSLLTTMLHIQLWRVNQTPVYGFWMEIHFLGGWISLAFSGLKENVNFLSRYVNLYVVDHLSSWLWKNHFKVENFNISIKLSWFFLTQLSNNSQSSAKIQFCYCLLLFWWKRLTERFPAAW